MSIKIHQRWSLKQVAPLPNADFWNPKDRTFTFDTVYKTREEALKDRAYAIRRINSELYYRTDIQEAILAPVPTFMWSERFRTRFLRSLKDAVAQNETAGVLAIFWVVLQAVAFITGAIAVLIGGSITVSGLQYEAIPLVFLGTALFGWIGGALIDVEPAVEKPIEDPRAPVTLLSLARAYETVR